MRCDSHVKRNRLLTGNFVAIYGVRCRRGRRPRVPMHYIVDRVASEKVFDQLSRNLSDQKRREMLADIRRSAQVEPEEAPLEVAPPPAPITDHLSMLSLWERIRLFIERLVRGESREAVVHRWIVRTIERDLKQMANGTVDARQRILLEPAAVLFEGLADHVNAAATLLAPLRERRRLLVFVLAGQLLPTIHHELLRVTAGTDNETEGVEREKRVREVLTRRVDETLESISRDQGLQMRRAVALCDRLQRLAELPVHGLLSTFEPDRRDANRRICRVEYVERTLAGLADELYGVPASVDPRVLESIVLVARDDLATDAPDEELFATAVRDGLAVLMGMITTLRSVAARIPFVPLVRVVRNDPWWSPREGDGGGEEWLAIYRGHFAARVDSQVHRIMIGRTIRDELAAIIAMTEGASDWVSQTTDGLERLPLSTRRFSFIAIQVLVGAFRDQVWPALGNIRHNGEFYKPANRAAFEDAMTEYEALSERVLKIREPEAAHAEGAHADAADAAAEQRGGARVDAAVERAHLVLDVLVKVLDGILYAQAGGPYDTLANFGQIGGRHNPQVIEDLKSAHERLRRFASALRALHGAERRAVELNVVLSDW